MIAGSVAVYVCGLVWLKHSIPFGWHYVVHSGFTVFVPGDLLKILAAAAILDPRAPRAVGGPARIRLAADDLQFSSAPGRPAHAFRALCLPRRPTSLPPVGRRDEIY